MDEEIQKEIERKAAEEAKAKEAVQGEDNSTNRIPAKVGRPEVYKPIDDANLAAKRMEDATKALRTENDRAEEIAAKQALGGTTEAGQVPAKPKEETNADYAKQVMAGEVPKK